MKIILLLQEKIITQMQSTSQYRHGNDGGDSLARREMTKMKISTIIKAYICMNKNRYCYSNEIAKFINENYFTLEKTVVNPKAVTRMIMDRRHYGIFRDVEINEEEHLKKFKLME